jgi:hypothetical protein
MSNINRKNNSFWKIKKNIYSLKCEICYEHFDDSQVIELKCGHQYHQDCYDDSEKHVQASDTMKCPLCRTFMPKHNEVKEQEESKNYICPNNMNNHTYEFSAPQPVYQYTDDSPTGQFNQLTSYPHIIPTHSGIKIFPQKYKKTSLW